MATKSIADIESELRSIQQQLFPLYSAQESANLDAVNAYAAQNSATGAALTEAIIALIAGRS